MLEFHAAHKSLVTLLGKKVDEREATNYGCMVTKPPAAGASAGTKTEDRDREKEKEREKKRERKLGGKKKRKEGRDTMCSRTTMK